MNSRLLPLGAAFLALLIVLTAVWILDQSEQSRILQENRTDVLHELSRIRAELELALAQRAHLADPLVTHITTHGQISADLFNTYSALLAGKASGIHAIGLVRDGIVTHIHPRDRYGSFVGSNWQAYGNQKAAIERAIERKSMVIGGPAEVDDFGTVMIARTPIFIEQNSGAREQLWGLVSIVMSLDSILEEAGLKNSKGALEVALRRADGLGPGDGMLFGNPELFDPVSDAATLEIHLEGGSWQLCAVPRGGWPETAAGSWKWRTGGTLLGLLAATMTFSLIRQPVRLRRAVRQATSELRKSEARYRRLFEDSRDPIYITNQEDRIIDANPAAVDLLGYSREEIIGKNPRETYADPSDYEKFKRDIQARGSVRGYVEKLRHKDGHEIFCQVSSSIRRNEKGEFIGYQGILRDITPRLKAEEALRKSEEASREQAKSLAAVNAMADTLYRSLDFATVVNSAMDSLIRHIAVPTTSLFSVNAAEDTMTPLAYRGIAQTAVSVGTELPVNTTFTGRAVRTKDIVVTHDIAREEPFLEASRKHLLALGYQTLVAVPLLYKDHVEGVMNLLFKERHEVTPQERETLLSMGKTIAMAMTNARQVTRIEAEMAERKRAEEALRHAQFALDHATEAVFWVEAAANYTYVNEAACALLGYTRGQLLSMGVQDIDPDYTPQRFAQYWKQLKKSGAGTVEVRVRSRTGEIIPVELTVNLLEFQGREFACTFARDLRDRKRAEQEKEELEARLRHTQKMEAIGNLAGGVAHDFNNLLTGILGYSSMLKMGNLPPEKIAKAAGVIEQAATRAAELTSQLLGFARRGKLQIQPVNIHSVIQEVLNLLERTMEKHIRISKSVCRDNPVVLGDPGQIQQVILNLAVNARDAMPEGGDLFIATRIAEVAAEPSEEGRELQPGRYVVIEVRDTGQGIAPEHLERVFEPFFTTKEQGKGTGMGLAMAYGIVRNHGGVIRIESAPGEGTTVRVFLPLTKEALESTESAKATPLPKGEGRVLLVDDEAVVRDTASALLTALGYEVEVAADAREGLELFSANPGRFDLVVLDMILPGMDGGECFRRMKAIHPGVKAILSTGYGRDGAAQEILNEGIAGFIQKPYRIQTLSEVILQAMRTPAEKSGV